MKEDEGPTDRDFVLARAATAISYAQNAISALQEMIVLWNNPDDDEGGKERIEALESALNDFASATKALESAEEVMPEADLDEVEPWEE